MNYWECCLCIETILMSLNWVVLPVSVFWGGTIWDLSLAKQCSSTEWNSSCKPQFRFLGTGFLSLPKYFVEANLDGESSQPTLIFPVPVRSSGKGLAAGILFHVFPVKLCCHVVVEIEACWEVDGPTLLLISWTRWELPVAEMNLCFRFPSVTNLIPE